MKKTLTYIALVIVIILLLALIGLKFFYKGEKEEKKEPPATSKPVVSENVVFSISFNHARKEGDKFVEDWSILEKKVVVKNGETLSNIDRNVFIKDIEIKADGVIFQLNEQGNWKSMTLKFNENYKYLSKDYQYTNVMVQKLNIEGFTKLSNDTITDKVYYEARSMNAETDIEADKIGSHIIHSLEELKAISNSEIVATYQNYDFTNNSLYVTKDYGNRTNNCYKSDKKVTLVLSKDKELRLVQEHLQEAEVNCIPVMTDIKYRVFEIKGKYNSYLLDDIKNYIKE